MYRNFIKELTIGNLKIKNNLFLAPMAGISDLPFRVLAKEGGVGVVCTEMISAKALEMGHSKTKKMLQVNEFEKPVSVQIFGSDPIVMANAAKECEQGGAQIVDINLGCPVQKIKRSGAGVKLTEDEIKLAKVIEAVVKAVSIPVSVKMRIGLTVGQNTSPHIAKIAQESGVCAVILHGRPAALMHCGPADLEAIKETVESIKIPVIANGGIDTPESALEFVKKTGCAGLMIGRAAIGDPFLFSRIISYFSTGDITKPPNWEERFRALERHCQICSDHYGEKSGLMRMRKVAPYYLKGMPAAARLRKYFNTLTKVSDVAGLMTKLKTAECFDEQYD